MSAGMDNLEAALEHKLLKQLYAKDQPEHCFACGLVIIVDSGLRIESQPICKHCAEGDCKGSDS